MGGKHELEGIRSNGEEDPLLYVGKNPTVICPLPAAKRYYRSSERYYRLGGTTKHWPGVPRKRAVVPPERYYRRPKRYYRLGSLAQERRR